MAAFWKNFNRYAYEFSTIQSHMPPGPLKIKEKSYSTNAPLSDMPTNALTVNLYRTILRQCQYNIYFKPKVTLHFELPNISLLFLF